MSSIFLVFRNSKLEICYLTTEMPPLARSESILLPSLSQVTEVGGCGVSSARQVRLMSLSNCTKTSRSPMMRALETEIKTRQESSMIHSARPAHSPTVKICFCFGRFRKVGTDGQYVLIW